MEPSAAGFERSPVAPDDAAMAALAAQWEGLGNEDPLWAVVSRDERRHGAWDQEAFDATGRHEVRAVLAALDAIGVRVRGRRALDFGCGVGRLTRTLAERFREVDGVDISASMLTVARRLNRHGRRVRFHHNVAADLHFLRDGTFDFALSLVVLQHMRPELQEGFVRDIVRVLRPGGVAALEIATAFAPPVERFRLADGAYRAHIAMVGPRPPLRAGVTEVVEVDLTNAGDVPWEPPPATYWGDVRLRLGTRWRDAHGTWLPEEDDRTTLDRRVEPGHTVRLPLRLTPPRAGALTAEVDVVHEHITWFADKGSSPLRFSVEVAEPDGAATAPGSAPPIQMHALPAERVRTVVTASGGDILAELPTDRSQDVVDRIFVVHKRSTRWGRGRAPSIRPSACPLVQLTQ